LLSIPFSFLCGYIALRSLEETVGIKRLAQGDFFVFSPTRKISAIAGGKAKFI